MARLKGSWKDVATNLLRSVLRRDVLTIASLIGLLGIAFGLRVYNLGTPTLWLDEAVSAFIANESLTGIIAYTRSHPFEHPPFYYLLLSLWTKLAGRSELALRFFSVFWGLLFPPLLYRFTRRFFDQRVAFWAAIMAALSPYALAYSREARMYTLVMFLSLLSIYLWLQAMENGGMAWWATYVFVTLVGLGTHYYFSLVILAEVLFMALRWRRFRQAMGRFALCQAGIAAPLLLWLLSSDGPVTSVKQIFVDPGMLGQRSVEDLVRMAVDLTLGGVVFRPLGLVDYLLPLGPLAVLLVGMLLWPGAERVGQGDSLVTPAEARLFLLLFLIIAFLVAFLFPFRFTARYLTVTFVSICLFLASGFISLGQKSLLALGAGVLLVGPAFAYGTQSNLAFVKSMYGLMMQEVNSGEQPGDGLILNPRQWLLFEYYYRGSLPHYYLPKSDPYGDAHYYDYYYTGNFDRDVASSLEEILARHSRVWLVMVEGWNADPENKIERWLNQHAYQAYKAWFGNDILLAIYFAPGAYESYPGPQDTFENQLRLQGYRVSPGPVAAGDAIRLDLHWQAMQPMNQKYLVSLRLVDPAGHVWAEKVGAPQGGWYETTEWRVGELVTDKHALFVPPGTPPGRYFLQLGVYDQGRKRSLALLDEKQSPHGIWMDLGSISIIRPLAPPAEKSLKIPEGQWLRTRFADKLLLLGYIMDGGQPVWMLKQGESRTMTLYWRALTRPEGDFALLVRLLDNGGRIRVQQTFHLGGPDYPTSGWVEGEVVKAQYDLLIPADLEGGDYRLQVAVQDLGTGSVLQAYPAGEERGLIANLFSWGQPVASEYLDLARIRVEERQRRFVVPPIQYPRQADLAHQVRFLGYDLNATQVGAGGSLHLTLYWQALAQMDRSYKVFTHLVDDQNRIWAQHDSIPANWSLPTTGWVKGEVIMDEHEIPLKQEVLPGTYILAIGMYDPVTGQRLLVYDAQGQPQGDRLVLSNIEIIRPR